MKKLEATVNNLPQRRAMAEAADALLEACAGDFQLAVEALVAIQEQGEIPEVIQELNAYVSGTSAEVTA